MPKIIVRRCPFTGALFESDREYAKHLKALRKEHRFDRIDRRFRREQVAFFTGMRATCKTAEDIENFVRTNWKRFVFNAWHNYAWKTKTPPRKLPVLVSIELCIEWSDNVSNTHSAPLTGPWAGKTNWGGQSVGVPRGYPGWYGHIKWTLEGPKYSDYMSGAELFKQTGIHTGSGSGGLNHWYGVELFADDWPAMLDTHNREIVKKAVGFKYDDKELV